MAAVVVLKNQKLRSYKSPIQTSVAKPRNISHWYNFELSSGLVSKLVYNCIYKIVLSGKNQVQMCKISMSDS